MRFRIINIPRLVFQLLRSNYAIANKTENNVTYLFLNRLYKFIVCCLYDLTENLNHYFLLRQRYFMIASCIQVRGQVIAVLNHLYGQYGLIQFGDESFQDFYLYDATAGAPPVYFHTDNPVYLGFAGAAANKFTVLIPIELKNNTEVYSDFIADINAIIMYGLTYEIKTY